MLSVSYLPFVWFHPVPPVPSQIQKWTVHVPISVTHDSSVNASATEMLAADDINTMKQQVIKQSLKSSCLLTAIY